MAQQSSMQLRLLFVINPVSGGKKKADPEELIKNYFRERQEEIHFFVLDKPQQKLTDLIKKIKPGCVIAVGGDGTVKMVAEQLVNTDIPLGILPAGSANGMATELNIPADWEQVLALITREQPSTVMDIDLIQINGKEVCIHLSDVGLNALLVKNFEQRGIRGKLGYALSAFKTLWQNKRLEVKIENKKMHLIRHAHMIVLANARMYGTGASINPDGDLTDGLFEVVILRKLSIPELLKMLFRHRPFDPTKTEILQADQVNISTRNRAHFQIDGEYLGKTRQIRANILPRALKVIVPAPAEAAR
ncbi:diacylglycerol/lipid kinase family protein [Chitinophaga filiformis]|uniref:Diacylglycerol kinase family lipid kinase n=1 Tax=Chitinophaga filiformis TaxID=104663 RepID=A0ABY4I0M9_CHIFI|nr:diacylglycerol kinase family protein [Chitinophaga filiformis]UPK68251.1 diacylglycerol kinase family lipid kinase [Chitinophaga filiformis]